MEKEKILRLYDYFKHGVKSSTINPQLDICDLLEELLSSNLNLEGCSVKIDEAKSLYPSEDFLQSHINRLLHITKESKSLTKTALVNITKDITASLESLQSTIANNTAYGISELKDAKECLNLKKKI